MNLMRERLNIYSTRAVLVLNQRKAACVNIVQG
jgi:hypothetical protein